MKPSAEIAEIMGKRLCGCNGQAHDACLAYIAECIDASRLEAVAEAAMKGWKDVDKARKEAFEKCAEIAEKMPGRLELGQQPNGKWWASFDAGVFGDGKFIKADTAPEAIVKAFLKL